MRGFGRCDHVTKELIVFGHVGTKVHSTGEEEEGVFYIQF